MRFVDEKSKEEYKKFLEGHERCNFQQSLEWGKVKDSWTNEVVLAEDENGNIIGSLSVLIRKIPIFGNLMYSSRGPVCDIHDEKVLKQLTDGVKELAKKYHAFVLKIEPDIKSDDKEFREIFAGFHQKTRYNIRLATKKGVTVKEGTKEDLKDFHKIMVETGSRDGFIIRSLEYFEKMYDELAPEHMKLLMAYYEGKPISGNMVPLWSK